MKSGSKVQLHNGHMANKGAETQLAFHHLLRVAVQGGEVTVAVVEV